MERTPHFNQPMKPRPGSISEKIYKKAVEIVELDDVTYEDFKILVQTKEGRDSYLPYKELYAYVGIVSERDPRQKSLIRNFTLIALDRALAEKGVPTDMLFPISKLLKAASTYQPLVGPPEHKTLEELQTYYQEYFVRRKYKLQVDLRIVDNELKFINIAHDCERFLISIRKECNTYFLKRDKDDKVPLPMNLEQALSVPGTKLHAYIKSKRGAQVGQPLVTIVKKYKRYPALIYIEKPILFEYGLDYTKYDNGDMSDDEYQRLQGWHVVKKVPNEWYADGKYNKSVLPKGRCLQLIKYDKDGDPIYVVTKKPTRKSCWHKSTYKPNPFFKDMLKEWHRDGIVTIIID